MGNEKDCKKNQIALPEILFSKIGNEESIPKN